MPRGRQAPPSYHQDFAHNESESAYPDLWKGLVGAWVPALGVTGIITLRDVSGYANHGTLNGAMTISDWQIFAKPEGHSYAAYRLELDGSDDFIEISSAVGLVDVTQGSFVVWGAFNTTGGLEILIEAFVDGSNFISLRKTAGDALVLRYREGAVNTDASAGTPGTTFHNVTGAWDASNVHIWDNGALIDTTSRGNDIVAPTVLQIGIQDGGGSSALDGSVGMGLLYNRAITTNEALIHSQVFLAPFILRDRLAVKAPAAAAAEIESQRLLIGHGI